MTCWKKLIGGPGVLCDKFCHLIDDGFGVVFLSLKEFSQNCLSLHFFCMRGLILKMKSSAIRGIV